VLVVLVGKRDLATLVDRAEDDHGHRLTSSKRSVRDDRLRADLNAKARLLDDFATRGSDRIFAGADTA
jgi:hypothetical protein